MTIAELIKLLKQFPPETDVFLSSDEEGNRYSPVSNLPGICIMKDGEPQDCDESNYDTVILYPTESR